MALSGSQIVLAAEKYTGVPYSQKNPQSPLSGLDCSGLVQLALQNLGLNVPRTTSQQLAAAKSGSVGIDIGTNLAAAQPGDIIHYLGHEEIYLGGGKVFSEATFGTKAAVRNRDPAPIVGIVRYSSTSGISLTSDVTSNVAGALVGSATSGITDWISSVAVRTGLVVFGAAIMIMGIILATKDTAVGNAAIKAVKTSAVVA